MDRSQNARKPSASRCAHQDRSGYCGATTCLVYEIEGAKDILAKLINDADLEVAMIADQAAGDVSDEDFIGMIAGRLTFAAGTEAAKKHTFASVGLNAYCTGSQWYEKTGKKSVQSFV